MSETPPGFPLAEVIADLRGELLSALDEGRGKALRFKLQPVELELKVSMTRGVDANAGIKFWVIDVGGKGKVENVLAHTLKLTLEPTAPSGEPFLVSDELAQVPAGFKGA